MSKESGDQGLTSCFSSHQKPTLASSLHHLSSWESALPPWSLMPLSALELLLACLFLSAAGEIKCAQLYGHFYSCWCHHCFGESGWNEANTFIQYLYWQGWHYQCDLFFPLLHFPFLSRVPLLTPWLTFSLTACRLVRQSARALRAVLCLALWRWISNRILTFGGMGSGLGAGGNLGSRDSPKRSICKYLCLNSCCFSPKRNLSNVSILISAGRKSQ